MNSRMSDDVGGRIPMYAPKYEGPSDWLQTRVTIF